MASCSFGPKVVAFAGAVCLTPRVLLSLRSEKLVTGDGRAPPALQGGQHNEALAAPAAERLQLATTERLPERIGAPPAQDACGFGRQQTGQQRVQHGEHLLKISTYGIRTVA
jgi:hypothetical protein